MTASAPKLTVVTIGYNSIDGLRATRASVKNQTYDGVEHLLIDGGSTDGSAEIVVELAGEPNVRAITEPDSGIYDAMNKAIDLVDAGYLMFLHAGDTFVDDEAVDRAMTAIAAATPAPDLAIGWSRFVSDGEPLPFVVGGPTPNAITSAHESTIFSHTFHQHERYNTELKLGADYEFFRQLFVRPEIQVLRLDFTISNFVFGGRSNDPAYDGARFLERARIDAGFGEVPTSAGYVRIAARMTSRKMIHQLLGAHRAATLFLRLACRRGNSGARRLPVGQVRVPPSAG